MKKYLCLILALIICLSLFPTSVFAAGITTGNATIKAPVAGETPSFTAVSSDPTKFSVEVLNWVECDTGAEIREIYIEDAYSDYYHYTFKGGKDYYVIIRFNAEDGYELSYSNSFTINGQTTWWTINGLTRVIRFTASGSGGGMESANYAAEIADINLSLPANYTSNDFNDVSFKKSILLTNTGNRVLSIRDSGFTFSGKDASKFCVRTNSVVGSVSVGQTVSSWFVEPELGLAPGTYTATLSFTDRDGYMSSPATATVKLTVNDHNFNTSVWKNDGETHWNPCTDNVCFARGNEASHNSNKIVGASAATFSTDGYTGDKYCSVCDRLISIGTPIPAGKYIRESSATMAPAQITSDYCANDLVFKSADPSKYTVSLMRVIDSTDPSQNTSGTSYPNNKKFIEGHSYYIEFRFNEVAPYVYDAEHPTYWSSFKLNGAPVEQSNTILVGGTPLRMIMMTAEAGVPTYNVTFNMNGHGTAPKAQTVKSGSAATKPANPTAAGYAFGGWYTDSTLKTVFDFTKPIVKDTVVYAKWTKTEPVVYPAGKGDINGDTNINAIDANLMKRILAGSLTPTAKQYDAADINSDTNVNAIDASLLLMMLIG